MGCSSVGIGIGIRILIILCVWMYSSSGEPYQDKQALLDFIRNTTSTPSASPSPSPSPSPHHNRILLLLNWTESNPVCTTWAGVTCTHFHNRMRVTALRLPGAGLSGPLPPNTLGRLSALEILSLRSNSFTGPFPPDLLGLRNLTALHLQFNRFSGPLPSDLSSVWGPSISIINLSNNQFNGTIPHSSFSNLTRLAALDLSGNSLSGQVPPGLGDLPGLKYLNLSHNNLSGPVPNSLLHRFPKEAFDIISDSSSSSPPPYSPPPSSTPVGIRRTKIGETAMIGIILGGCFLLFATIAFFTLGVCSNREGAARDSSSSSTTTTTTTARGKEAAKMNKPKLKKKSGHDTSTNTRITFFEGSNLAFDLEDLLRASAEVLGKGTFGTTYKAALEDGSTVVVKRLKEVTVGRRDFEQQMEAVGRVRHDNVAALIAYYYSKEEKLVVYDYYTLGSVSTLLHGGKTAENRTLDWHTRLRIANGAARGLAHIHAAAGGESKSSSTWTSSSVHGNIKSSNIFLTPLNQSACLSDVGLATIVTPLALPTRSSGYRAPELTDHSRKPTQASDVYSFGVFLLELLTGRSPLGEGMNLVKWVNSVVREEWTAEVFDVELLRYPNVEEEMVQMLQLGMSCSLRVPDQRPKMRDVVTMLHDIGRRSGASTPAHLDPLEIEIGSASTPTLTSNQ